MKKIVLILTVTVSLLACKSNDKNASGTKLTEEQKQKALSDSSNFTTIQWIDSTMKNVGKLTPDQKIEISFRFKNTGAKNLIFDNVSAPCGCTIPEKPDKPFAPGEEGMIKATYNGSGHGTITKMIYVKANTRPSTDHTLTFTGEVGDK